MASFQRNWVLAGGAAAALVAALPAHAEDVSTQVATITDFTEAVTAQVETATEVPKATKATIEANNFEMVYVLASDFETPIEEVAQTEAEIEPEQIAVEVMDDASATSETETLETTTLDESVQTVDEYLAASETAPLESSVATSAEFFFGVPEVAQNSETVEGGQEVAQVTRPLYRGVSPFYVGVGGTIGIVDSDKSAVGDFGFNVFSKVSLGPRFAVRPMLQFSEDDFNITLPITFNFNPIDLGRFSVYPALGGGVDFGDDIGLLVNGSVDVPISREFTLNSQVNWRVSEETGLGISLGVAYNFPIFFE